MRYLDCGYGFAGMSGFGGLFMILLWIIIIFVCLALIRRLFWSGKMPHRRDMFEHMYDERDPLDILKERYAKGEINKIEFEEKKKDLNL